MALLRDDKFDAKLIVVRNGNEDTIWNGGISGTTITDVGGKLSLDVNVTDITLSANNDSMETRSLAMKTLVDEASSTVTYVGEAAVGSSLSTALWRIKRLTQSGTVLLIEWADGDSNFNNIWDNRASLSYS